MGRTEEQGPTRRRVLTGLAVSGATWATPSIVGSSRAVAAGGSCVDETVNWGSVSGPTSGVFTATGTTPNASVTAQVTTSSTGTAEVYINGTNLIWRMRDGHSIGDSFSAVFTFTSFSGTVCAASVRILDFDRNDVGLGCPANSRFNDLLTGITGPNVVVTPEGGLVTDGMGNWSSGIDCKTGDLENAIVSWSDAAGVSGAGLTWVADAPHNGSTTLDLQLVKVQAPVLCHTGLPPVVVAPASVDLQSELQRPNRETD